MTFLVRLFAWVGRLLATEGVGDDRLQQVGFSAETGPVFLRRHTPLTFLSEPNDDIFLLTATNPLLPSVLDFYADLSQRYHRDPSAASGYRERAARLREQMPALRKSD